MIEANITDDYEEDEENDNFEPEEVTIHSNKDRKNERTKNCIDDSCF